MENLVGMLRIRIKRGIDLAIRDNNKTSDPYVLIRLAKQKLKTQVVKKCLNPEWNGDLTLCITNPNQPVELMVYDKDTFTFDDKMGDAEFDIKPYLDAVKTNLKGIPSGTILAKLKPGRDNCLVEESNVTWLDGEVVQNMFLRLRNVEHGEIELELRWTHVLPCRVCKEHVRFGDVLMQDNALNGAIQMHLWLCKQHELLVKLSCGLECNL